MIWNLLNHSINNALGGSGSIVILDDGFPWCLAGLDDLEGWKTLDAEFAAEWLVGFFVAVDGCYFGEACETGCGFFVGWLEVFAVSTPGGIEFDNLLIC